MTLLQILFVRMKGFKSKYHMNNSLLILNEHNMSLTIIISFAVFNFFIVAGPNLMWGLSDDHLCYKTRHSLSVRNMLYIYSLFCQWWVYLRSTRLPSSTCKVRVKSKKSITHIFLLKLNHTLKCKFVFNIRHMIKESQYDDVV